MIRNFGLIIHVTLLLFTEVIDLEFDFCLKKKIVETIC